MSLFVSVILSSCFPAHLLRETIDSVLAQNYSGVELLVVGDEDDPESMAILKSYGERLRFIPSKKRNQSGNFNDGLNAARGDIVCWLSIYDTLTGGATSAAVKAFEDHPDVEFIYGKSQATLPNGRVVEPIHARPFNLWVLVNHYNFIPQSACFFRRTLLQKVGLADESLRYTMDWDLWIRFSPYKSLFLDSVLSCHRLNAEHRPLPVKIQRLREMNRMLHRYTNLRWPPALYFYSLETIDAILYEKPISSVRITRWQQIAQYLRVNHSVLPIDRVKLSLFSLLMPGIKLSRSLVAIVANRIQQLINQTDYSGSYDGGGVAPTFHFSVSNRGGEYHQVGLCLTPLSRYAHSRMNCEPIRVHWSSSSGETGEFSLLENGQVQEQTLPLHARTTGGIEHFTCETKFSGMIVDKGRRIIGFLDEVRVI